MTPNGTEVQAATHDNPEIHDGPFFEAVIRIPITGPEDRNSEITVWESSRGIMIGPIGDNPRAFDVFLALQPEEAVRLGLELIRVARESAEETLRAIDQGGL